MNKTSESCKTNEDLEQLDQDAGNLSQNLDNGDGIEPPSVQADNGDGIEPPKSER
ncbi:hypothetical protein JQC92_02480 [Shewanella sp. 202IG2-18]|uniref:hypothetical protein n=1 Tax=Parashewanella hymeniacidonis TaxID=2807618 RepID=UPI001960A93C|nr:hypothetical protein [Parashewanella hymeniacidonis]MBM7070908.1 hypothetical protein [Parashewanella hymeniacidonis]